MGLSKEKQKLFQKLQNSRQRVREGLFLVEGIRGAREFLDGGARLKVRFAATSPRLEQLQGGAELSDRLRASGVPTEELEDRELWAISATEQPQGVLLVVEEPVETLASDTDLSSSRLLLLDGIQDPGNVGTLLRAARGFGLDAVVALDGTCDPWNPKAVRASAGASAHIRVLKAPWEEVWPWVRSHGLPLWVAEAAGVDVRGTDPSTRWALVVGGEGRGVRQEIRAVADRHLAIPLASGVDSLNVALAGAILLFVLNPPPKDQGKP